MKKIYYFTSLFFLLFVLSCDTQNELDGFLDPNGSEFLDPGDGGGDGDLIVPIGDGDPTDGDEPVGDIIIDGEEFMCPNSIATFEINGITSDMTWQITGDFTILNEFDNKIILYTNENFSGGKVSASSVTFSFTWNIKKCLTLPNPNCNPDYSIDLGGSYDEYIGSAYGSNINAVYIHLHSNWPSGTTYQWEVTREDGTIENYPFSTEVTRKISASYDNPIVQAIVTAKYDGCEEIYFGSFKPAVPQKGSTKTEFSITGLKFAKQVKFIKKFLLK